MNSLSVVALISGGKDSLFSILHCNANGHRVVALANLHPSGDLEDSDSYMYQTIGHKIIPLYEEALGLPLYRQRIHGSLIHASKDYGLGVLPAMDEVEDMYELLATVKRAHPEVNAVCTGAILSDYQRTRVESVAVRLGLTPLSYLWKFPYLPPYTETSLLADMAAAGQDARIIKTASGDLDAECLWCNVADQRFVKRATSQQRWGGVRDIGSALGEGGEYETLAIDGPSSLWKASIVIADDDRQILSGEAGSSSLKVVKASVRPKDTPTIPSRSTEVRIPPVLDDKFAEIHLKLLELADLLSGGKLDDSHPTDIPPAQTMTSWQVHHTPLVHMIYNATDMTESAASQIQNILDRLVSEHKIDPERIIFSNIILRSMSDFPHINSVYGSYFKTPIPPARVTIACGESLPQNVLVSLSVAVSTSTANKQGLHVQSRSYWAPANIGPYSQATVMSLPRLGDFSTLRKIYVAGQIPLHPASMNIYSSGVGLKTRAADQITISLQHLWRIGREMNVCAWLGAVAMLSKKDSAATSRDWAILAGTAWDQAHDTASVEDEESADVDIWDLKHGLSQPPATRSTYENNISTTFAPPCFAVEVEALPRDVGIEWCSIGLENNPGEIKYSVVSEDTKWQHTKIVLRSNGQITVVAGWIAVFDQQVSAQELPAIEANNAVNLYTTPTFQSDSFKSVKAQTIPCRWIGNDEASTIYALLTYQAI